MEYAVRLDGERLVGMFEATVRNLELLAILPEKDPTNESDFQPAVRVALHRQVLFALPTDVFVDAISHSTRFQSVVEAALEQFTAQQKAQKNDRPKTDEVGDPMQTRRNFSSTQRLRHHFLALLPLDCSRRVCTSCCRN
ncbi:hypothetical protein DVH05_004284 [Phytophthora capsici]|nr:hypothetical protein DVH05_004284 [Phytophthora capsici]